MRLKTQNIILLLVLNTIDSFALSPPFPPPSDNTPEGSINIGIYLLMLIGLAIGIKYKYSKNIIEKRN